MKNANEIKFRSSSIHYIMGSGNSITEKQIAQITELQAKMAEGKITDKQKETLTALIYKRDHPELSATCKTHLVNMFVAEKYKRREEIASKYLTKGNAREEDAITLLSRVNKIFYKKNSIRLKNDFVQGEWDMHLGDFQTEQLPNGTYKVIVPATHTLDTKCSWSAHTFFRSKNSELDDAYWYQGHCYMDLTGARNHTVAFCLVNGLASVIEQEKRNLAFRMGVHESKNPGQSYIEKCKQIEINHIFDLQSFIEENPQFVLDNDPSDWHFDIPMRERLHLFSFDRDETIIKNIHKKVAECREWMNINLFKALEE